MNIERLVAAAKEIDRKALLQEENSIRLQQYATLIRQASKSGDEKEVRRLQNESRNYCNTVVDFGDALAELRRALKAKPSPVNAAN